MKIEITKLIRVKDIIDVELPYYYKHNLSGENDCTIIYGKINKDYEITINESQYDDIISYEIERSKPSDCYFDDEYKSTKDEFENVKLRALKFINES